MAVGSNTFLSGIASAQLQQNTPNGLATLLHRGMGSRHLPVMWEGINIQSMLNGSFDLSLIPMHLYTNSGFYTFGSPTLAGSNALAGMLSVGQNKYDNSGFVGVNFSTLNNADIYAKLPFHKQRYSAVFSGDISLHQNHYTYKSNQDNLKMEGTDQQKYNLIYQATHFVKNNQSLHFHVWHQGSNRSVASSIASASSPQHQEDENTRIKSDYSIIFKKGIIKSWVLFMAEKINFATPAIDSRSKANIYSTGASYSTPKEFVAQIIYRKDIVNANFYIDQKSRSQINLSALKAINVKKMYFSLAARQDFIDQKWMPFSFTTQIRHKNTNLQIARNYNLPGFNDLYWPVSGNKNLKTEVSYQAELNQKYNLKNLNFELQIYGNHVENWIQWSPSQNGQWIPTNQKKVLSRGFESKISKIWTSKTFQFKGTLHYHFNRTNAIDHYYEMELIGKQLIYVPKHILTSSFEVNSPKAVFHTNFRYSGLRYDSPDNQYYLPPYFTVDVAYRRRFSSSIEGTAIIQNLTNHKYHIVRFFPLPGINASVLIKYYFKN